MSDVCEVCDSNNLRFLFEKDGYRYEKCVDCGLVRLHPQPTQEALEAIYQNGYFSAWGENESVFRSLKRRTFASILCMIPEKDRRGKLLDVGAATGILMELAQEQGYDPYGVEAAKDGATEIARKFGEEHVFTGYFDQLDFNNTDLLGNIDVVTMVDLFEHVRDPNLALLQVSSLLKPGGLLLLYLPAIDSWAARILGKNWNYYIPQHLFSFSQNNLSQILQKHGFEVSKLKSAPKYLTVEYFSNVLEKIPGGIGFLRPLLAHTPAMLNRIPIPLYVGQMKALAVKR